MFYMPKNRKDFCFCLFFIFYSCGLHILHLFLLLDMLHLCKNQLQRLAQRRNIQLPVYSCARDGPPHALRFKATVTVGEQTFESPEFFRTIKEAEHAIAKVALMSLSEGVQEVTLFNWILTLIAALWF